MIKYPLGEREVNESFIKSERKRIDMLNDIFFKDVELTKNEESILVWLCGYDDHTINDVISAFKKVSKDR